MNPIATKLRAIADELTEHPEHWTQGYNARDKEGEATNSDSELAVCWCSVGLLARTFPPNPFLAGAVKFVVARNALEEAVQTDCIAGWNDDAKRSVTEVIDAFRSAAELLERGGVA